MSATEQPTYSAPFDAVAARYDDTFTSSTIGRAQRTAVWEDLAKAFSPGSRLLEIGCGTAVDACFLAQRGVRVVACDASTQPEHFVDAQVIGKGLLQVGAVEPRISLLNRTQLAFLGRQQ